jgi:hypothetical protein
MLLYILAKSCHKDPTVRSKGKNQKRDWRRRIILDLTMNLPHIYAAMVEFKTSRFLLLVLSVSSALSFVDGNVKRETAGQHYREGDAVEIIVNNVGYVFVYSKVNAV